MLRAAVRDTEGIFFTQILHQVSQNYAKYPVSNMDYRCKTSQILPELKQIWRPFLAI